MTKMERWLAYINRELAILDYNSDHRDAFEEGKAEGRKEGEAKGRKEGEAKGRKEGEAKGRKEGEAKGRKEGEAKGRKEGEAQGRTKGRKEGEERLGMLMSLLLKENRHDDVAKAASDADFREKLFKEYGI